MKAFITRNIQKTELKLNGQQLFGHLWTPIVNGKGISISKSGDNIYNGYLSIRYDKNDDKINWLAEKSKKICLKREFIYVFPDRLNQNLLCICTDTREVLPVDECAFYRLVLLVAEQQYSDIANNDKGPWLSIKEFERMHSKLLHMSYATLMAKSLVVGEKMDLMTDETAFDQYYPYA